MKNEGISMKGPRKKTGSSKKVAAPLRQSNAPSKKRPQRSSAAARLKAPKTYVSDESKGLFDRIVSILDAARGRVVRVVHSEMVVAYFCIGREIVEHLQGGDARAEYGQRVLEGLSGRLTQRYGKGFSVTNLRYFRLFYQVYADRSPQIHHKAGDEFLVHGVTPPKHQKPSDVLDDLSLVLEHADRIRSFSPELSWSHYRALCKVPHRAERLFYEVEAIKEAWSVPHLERQIHTHLFARLWKSRDKAGVMDLAKNGQRLERPVDSLRDPYVLDFLNLPEHERLRESDFESALLAKLQAFILELGKGFAFVARQKRLAYDDECFYVDLVFYNCILKCYLLIDLKVGRLTHGDVGQMDSYVRLWDEQCTNAGDNPTIGLILCAEKNEAVARYSVLKESKQLFAAKYLTYLPTVEELQREIAEVTQSTKLQMEVDAP